jgi:hypothetical protein
LATKHSSFPRKPAGLDCFAALAMTRGLHVPSISSPSARTRGELKLDCRVKPGNDDTENHARLRGASAATWRSLFAMSALPPLGVLFVPGVQKSSGKSAQHPSAAASSPQAGVCVSLIQQRERIFLPFRRIDRGRAIVVRNGFFVFAEETVDLPARDKPDRLRFKLNHFFQVRQSKLRFAQVHPGQMSFEIGVRIFWVLFYPFACHMKVVLRI